MSLGDLSELVESAYDAAFDPDSWPTVLDRLADLLTAASGAAIVSYNAQTRRRGLLYPRSPPEYVRSFLEYWCHRCPILHYGKNHPVAAVLQPEMFVSREEYCSTEIFNEWFRPQRAEAMIGSKLLIEGPVSMFLALMRPFSNGDFEEPEIQLFDALIPHLQRAVQLQLRLAGLEGPAAGTAAILNRLPQGVLLVDAQSQVIFANLAAEALFRDRAGLYSGRDGLRAESADETRRLRKIIADCADPIGEVDGAGRRLRISREDRAPLIVLVIPQRSRLGWIDVVRPRATLFITDPEQTTAAHGGNLREDFGLTPAEAALALEILKSDGLKAAASRLGISPATAHTQLAHVFDKTGARRQAELVRLILQSQPAIVEG
jgi:DNA-binding CsgD family transcriptional regulator/PAS domain-containing protein